MKGKLILLVIIFYTAISRFFLIDKVPPILSPSIINLRILSAIANLVSTVLVFHLIKNYWKNTKVSFLSAWIFSVLPWVFEQGRINSGPNLALGLILFILFLIQKSLTKLKFVLLTLIPIVVFLTYPQFWIFRVQEFKLSASSFVINLFILNSFDFLFFKNITFWWGGVREFGVMFLTFLPFFLLGIYQFIIRKEKKLLVLLGLIIVIAALSPFFPESREFYFVTPIISLTVALGFYRWSLEKHTVAKAILFGLVLLIMYELSQFIHFYLVHYPQQVTSNFSQIHEAF